MALQCAYCENLDLYNEKKGQFYCKKVKEYVSATNIECRNYRRDRDRLHGDAIDAIDESVRYGYEDTEFNPRFYVISAISEMLGLTDEDENIYILKSYRTHVLQKDEKYKQFLFEYDQIGKLLARYLKNNYDTNFAREIYLTYVKGTAKLVKNHMFDEAFDYFNELIEKLKIQSGATCFYTPELLERVDFEKSSDGKKLVLKQVDNSRK